MSDGVMQMRIDGGICHVTLNRPDKLNAMNIALRKELHACFSRITSDDRIRVVVVTGNGRAFCAGGDISELDGSGENLNNLITRVSHQWYRALANIPQPVIAAVNGVAAGAGCSLALACDLVYASEPAFFVQSFVNIGLAPDQGAAYGLPRKIGMAKAKEMCFFGDRMSAQEALKFGLVNAVFPAESFMASVQERAQELASKSPHALQMIKRMLNRSYESSLDSILDMEAAAQSFLISTQDCRNAIDRFKEK